MKSIKFKHKNFKKVKIISNTSKREIIFNINNNFLLILKIIFLVFFISMDILILKSHFGSIEQSQDKLPEITSYLNGYYITSMEIQEFREYGRVNKFMEDNPKFEKSKNPIISVIVTMHNQAHCLHKCIKSIQNQSIKNIEILIVDDCSTDNTTDIIQQFQQSDPRIILYAHDINEGTIKSRSDGIKKAKGEYILVIDGDDALIHKDILKNSLYIAQLGNIDVVEFRMGVFSKGNLKKIIDNYSLLDLKSIIYQPELSTKFICINNRYMHYLRNRNICGKLIKNEIFKKVLKDIGPEYTDDYILYYEDTIMTISLLHIANSYYFMKEPGYLYSFDQKGKEFPQLENKKCKENNKIKDVDDFKFIKFLAEYTKDNIKEKALFFNEIMIIDYHKYFKKKLNEKQYQVIFSVFDKILESNFLTNEQKNKVSKLKNRFIEKMGEDKKYITD